VKETNKDYVVLYSSSNNPMKKCVDKIYKAMLLKKNYDFRTIDILNKCLWNTSITIISICVLFIIIWIQENLMAEF
jgi:hypothetical protein